MSFFLFSFKFTLFTVNLMSPSLLLLSFYRSFKYYPFKSGKKFSPLCLKESVKLCVSGRLNFQENRIVIVSNNENDRLYTVKYAPGKKSNQIYTLIIQALFYLINTYSEVYRTRLLVLVLKTRRWKLVYILFLPNLNTFTRTISGNLRISDG